MATVKTYRDLTAWQRAMDLACAVYQLTAALPKDETYGLARQVRAAAVSIASNLAEGQARGPREFKRFLKIGLGSLQELETQLLLAERLGFVNSQQIKPAMNLAAEVGRLLNGLRKSIVVE